MREERAREVRAAFTDRFSVVRDAWVETYLPAVEEALEAPEIAFRTPEFQRRLWEVDGVASVGSGSSVVVTGAYSDPEIVEAFWRLRNWDAPSDMLARARALDSEFERIVGLITPRHNRRRPLAKVARIFAVLRPHDVLCLLDHWRTSQFRNWLEQPAYKLNFIGQHVVLRQVLRDLLGQEPDLRTAVIHSCFSWFVWETYLKPSDPEAISSDDAPEGRATDTPSVLILPAKTQRKGINYLTNNLALVIFAVRAAENGIDRDSLDQQIAEEVPAFSRGTRSNLVSQITSLGLLAFENGAYRPTSAGRALLEGEAPSEVLTPTFIRTVFGFAQILDDLRREHELTRLQIAENCRRYYPRWTTDFAPNQLVSWLRELKLVDVEGSGATAVVRLTEAGEYWAGGLPAQMKTDVLLLENERPDEKLEEEESEVTATPLTAEFRPAPLDQIVERFRRDQAMKFLIFSDVQISLLHAALHAAHGKRFVLLAGLSGTGKTSIAQAYARAYCDVLALPLSSHYEQVAVWPDWTDPTGLLGFINPLATPPSFQQTAALRLLIRAANNRDKPYFLCLDEMNLARVEHYFAPFLSAMEGREGKLALHSSSDPVDGVPPVILWPENLFIIGTVNMDETTYPFSDKVLDRAFTFEFWDVDLPAWRNAAVQRGISDEVLGLVFPVLTELSAALKPARRHFGYRTCDEVVGFVGASGSDGMVGALDAAVLAKVLPKIRGDVGGALPQAIANALAVSDANQLGQTAAKLRQMQETLAELGAVRFWS